MSDFIKDMISKLQASTDTMAEMERRSTQYLFYESGRKHPKRKLCKCTACGNSGVFEIEGAAHKANVVCPMCMEPVTMIAHGKLKDDAPGLREVKPVLWFKELNDDLWAVNAMAVRWFERNSWDGPDWNCGYSFDIYSIYRFRPGRAEEWRSSYWYGWRVNACEPMEPRIGGNYFGHWGNDSYTVWQVEEITKSRMKYCAVELYFERHSRLEWGPLENGESTYGVIKYLAAYCREPKLEYAVKWGFDDIAKELIWDKRTNGRVVNWKADTPWEFLKISRAEWNQYRASDHAGLELLRARQRWIKIPMGQLLQMLEGLPRADGWLHYAKVMNDRGVTLSEQIKYIARQERNHNRDFAAWLRLWIDYLEMAEKLGRDVGTSGAIMPRDLPEAHDQMVELRRLEQEVRTVERRRREAKALENQYAQYKKRRKKLEKKYAYQSGDLEIRVPTGAEEIIREGNVLHICVGGYAARHLSGETTILFLRRRRKPDTPYICIEINEKNNEIVQIHGYRNEAYMRGSKRGRQPAEKHRDFLAEWMAWVKAGSRRDGLNKHSKEDKTA